MTGVLGNPQAYLGNFELGAGLPSGGGSIYDQSASNGLVLSHSLSLNTVLNQTPSNTLTVSQSATVLKVVNLTASNTLVFAQASVKTIPVHASNTFVISESNTILKQKVGVGSSTITFSGLASCLKTINRSIFDNLAIVHTVSKLAILNKSLSQTLTITESNTVSNTHPTHNTLTYSQTATAQIVKTGKNILLLDQNVLLNTVLNRALSTQFIPFQGSISLNHISNLTASNALVFNSSSISNSVLGAVNSLVLSQSAIVSNTRPANDEFVIDQSVDLIKTSNKTINQSLHLVSSVSLNKGKSYNALSILAFNQELRHKKVLTASASNTLTLSQEANKGLSRQNISQTLTLSQTATSKKIKTLIVNSVFNPTHSLNRILVYNRSLSQDFIFTDGFNKIVNLGPLSSVFVPPVVVGITRSYNLIKAAGRAITLPQFQFGDSYSNKSQMNIRTTMTGIIYTYVKHSDLEKLAFKCKMKWAKAYELRSFIESFSSQVCTLELWRGEIYKGYISNNPFEFIAIGPYGPEGEEIEATLEFEGVRLV
jgi:hypothetical protein